MTLYSMIFKANKPNIKKLVPIGVLVLFVGLSYVVINNPPSVKRGKLSQAPQLNVEVVTINPSDIAIEIDSYGTVQPRTQSSLIPQVSGQITAISANFQNGGFFEKGDVLVELDDRDYLAEINIAKASLYNARQKLSEEKARVEQAKQDWQRLGNSNIAPDLVLRKPQLLAAEASLYSAQASFTKAELALERTKIKAPYTGRILEKHVDLGQVISPNTLIADIYAVDYVEVRLPIKNKDLPFILLPESHRHRKVSEQDLPVVSLESELVDGQFWQGKIVRTEGAFDAQSQQLFVVAQIEDPYGKPEVEGLPIKIGQYVSAKITGNLLKQAITIPNKAIYQGSYVYIVQNNVLKRKLIEIAWQNDQIAMLKSGLNTNDLLVITALGQVNSGTPVALSVKDGKTVLKQRTRKKRPQGSPSHSPIKQRGEQ